jgi:hypothetical protein
MFMQVRAELHVYVGPTVHRNHHVTGNAHAELHMCVQYTETIMCLVTRAVESESEGILGGVGVGRNFRWSRSRKEF